ncbi:MAG: hypothetical protein JRF63_14100, partial [Deltaproteobacteria bacterium]|nr:hypothetical protein [Deltaproteobacteria bacterium]
PSTLADTCQGWTSIEASDQGITGAVSFTSIKLYNHPDPLPCNTSAIRLLCLEE